MPRTYYFVLTDTKDSSTIYAYQVAPTPLLLSTIIVLLEVNNYEVVIITKDVPPATFTTVPVHEVAELIS